MAFNSQSFTSRSGNVMEEKFQLEAAWPVKDQWIHKGRNTRTHTRTHAHTHTHTRTHTRTHTHARSTGRWCAAASLQGPHLLPQHRGTERLSGEVFWCRVRRWTISHVVRAPAGPRVRLQLSASRSLHNSRRANQTPAVTSVKWLELSLTRRQKGTYVQTVHKSAECAKIDISFLSTYKLHICILIISTSGCLYSNPVLVSRPPLEGLGLGSAFSTWSWRGIVMGCPRVFL